MFVTSVREGEKWGQISAPAYFDTPFSSCFTKALEFCMMIFSRLLELVFVNFTKDLETIVFFNMSRVFRVIP
jgi:hypothetical protein